MVSKLSFEIGDVLLNSVWNISIDLVPGGLTLVVWVLNHVDKETAQHNIIPGKIISSNPFSFGQFSFKLFAVIFEWALSNGFVDLWELLHWSGH